MASTRLHGQNELKENGEFHLQTSSALKTMSFDFQKNDSGFEKRSPKSPQAGSMSRKSLQTLQFSSSHEKQLVGKDGPIKQKFKANSKVHGSKQFKKKELIKPTNKPISFFMDPSPEVKRDEVNSNDDEAYQLMSNEPVPESYWKMLAEERRVALDDSLHENEILHKEIEILKDENVQLKEIAGQAEYLADVIQNAIGSSDEEEGGHVSLNDNDGNCNDQDGNDTEESDNPDDKTDSNAGHDSYLSSYDVISLTDENPHLSDVENSSGEKSIKPTDSDNVTLCDSKESQKDNQPSVPSQKSFQSSDESVRPCGSPVETLSESTGNL